MSAEYASISAARQAAASVLDAISADWHEAKTPIVLQDAKSLGHLLFAVTCTGGEAEDGSGISGADSMRCTFAAQFTYKLGRDSRVADMDGASDAAIAAMQALLGEQCTHRVLVNGFAPEWLENWALITIEFTDLIRFTVP